MAAAIGRAHPGGLTKGERRALAGARREGLVSSH
jgi:hypothetical protein